MHFELESDRDVTVSGIGLLEANVPVRLDETMLKLFELIHNTTIVKAQFPPYVSVTAVLGEVE